MFTNYKMNDTDTEPEAPPVQPPVQPPPNPPKRPIIAYTGRKFIHNLVHDNEDHEMTVYQPQFDPFHLISPDSLSQFTVIWHLDDICYHNDGCYDFVTGEYDPNIEFSEVFEDAYFLPPDETIPCYIFFYLPGFQQLWFPCPHCVLQSTVRFQFTISRRVIEFLNGNRIDLYSSDDDSNYNSNSSSSENSTIVNTVPNALKELKFDDADLFKKKK